MPARKRTPQELVTLGLTPATADFVNWLNGQTDYQVDPTTVALAYGLHREFGSYRHEHREELRAVREAEAKQARIAKLRAQLAELEGEEVAEAELVPPSTWTPDNEPDEGDDFDDFEVVDPEDDPF